jgi:hypothetical protein
MKRIDLTGQRFGRLVVVERGVSKEDKDGTPRVTYQQEGQ